MKKKLSIFLASVMAVSLAFSSMAMAEETQTDGESAVETAAEGESADEAAEEGESADETAAEGEVADETETEEAVVGFTTTGWQGEETEFDEITYNVIEADGEQVELGYLDSTTILEVDGLKFKDLNKNGSLDAYEDWRLSTEERVEDLYSQMTLEERCMLLYHVCTCGDNAGVTYNNHTLYDQDFVWGEQYASMWYYINVYGITSYLDNSNGTPDMQVGAHNVMQAMAEETRLGDPIILSCDREYNAWGGYIDTPHDAFGTANDIELSEQLWKLYSEETRAIGYHIVLQPSGAEIGYENGENPEYISEMTAAQVTAVQEGGTLTCVKHFIARGGDASFETAHSDANTVDNWMEGWKAAIEAGTGWIMTNGYNNGLTGDVKVDYDKATMSYLRDELGFDGVVLTDWGAVGNGMAIGTTVDGVDIASLSIPERYAWVINNGVTQMGAPGAGSEENTIAASAAGILSVTSLVTAVNDGLVTEETLKHAACQVLTSKFELGLFENPYSDGQKALELSASAEFLAEKWEITDNETLTAARNPEEVELERQLEAESAVLVKNDDNLLPLDASLKVYVESTASAETQNKLIQYISEYAEVTDEMEDADVVVADITNYNDQAEYIVEDAKDFGKKLVLVSNCVDPTAWAVENADALIFMNFTRTADHGTGVEGIITTTEPVVYAEILYGVREPAGMIVKEIARDEAMDNAQWKDLAGDQGADTYVRMLLLGIMYTSGDYSTPENYGDPLLCYKYGMRYGEDPVFEYNTLVLPKAQEEVEEETSSGTQMTTVEYDGAEAGTPFTVYTLLFNNGGDGITTVEATVDGEVVAQKDMAVNGGSWRVVQMEITIDEAGEHEITVGDITKTITVK